jgi:hypothetical protein
MLPKWSIFENKIGDQMLKFISRGSSCEPLFSGTMTDMQSKFGTPVELEVLLGMGTFG